MYHGGDAAPWTVTVRPAGTVEPSCLHRTVTVHPVGDVHDALVELKRWSPYLQTVGVAGFEGREQEIEEALSRIGVSRITPFARVPWPEPWWHHDGSGPLRDLVRWTDVEGRGGAQLR